MKIANKQLPLERPEPVVRHLGHTAHRAGQRVREPNRRWGETGSAPVPFPRLRQGGGMPEVLAGSQVVQFAGTRPLPLIVSHENIPLGAENPDAVGLAQAGRDTLHSPAVAKADPPAHELHVPSAAVPGVGEDKPPVAVEHRPVGEGVVMPGVTPIGAQSVKLRPAVLLIKDDLGEFLLL